MSIETLPKAPTRLGAAQLRGARAMLGLSLFEIAAAAGVSVAAVLRAERDADGRETAQSSGPASRAIRVALEARGIRFLEPDVGVFGVSLDTSATRRPVEGP